MKTKKVTRYYCDHCRRGMFSGPAMQKHERGCTANKDRVCGMCGQSPGQKPLADLLKILDLITDDNKEHVMSILRSEASDCPACIFATLRHHPRTSHERLSEDVKDGEYTSQSKFVTVEFNWKEECAAWWKERNEAQALRYSFNQ